MILFASSRETDPCKVYIAKQSASSSNILWNCLFFFTGACFKDQGIQYTCVAGSLVSGDKDAARKSLAKYACNSYREASLLTMFDQCA